MEDRKKIKNSNIDNYDLIILESFDKREENDSTIPNIDLSTIFKDILNYNGIFAINLRYETYNDKSIVLARLKKKYKRIIEIELRIGSEFILCCPDKNIKMINNYKPINYIIDEKILNEIEQKLKEVWNKGEIYILLNIIYYYSLFYLDLMIVIYISMYKWIKLSIGIKFKKENIIKYYYFINKD